MGKDFAKRTTLFNVSPKNKGFYNIRIKSEWDEAAMTMDISDKVEGSKQGISEVEA